MMDLYEMIPKATKDMVRIFAARGLGHGEVGFLTHLSESTVERILAEPHPPVPQELIEGSDGPVNTTPDCE